MVFAVLSIVLGILLLLFSTRAFMDSAIKTSLALRISPLVVGVTVVAVGTSLPELVVSLLAALRNEPGLAIGNIVGSNVVNVFLVFPLSIILRELKMGISKTQRNAALMLSATLVFFLINLFRIYSPLVGGLFIFLAFLFTIQEYCWGVSGRENEDSAYIKEEKAVFEVKTAFLLIVSLLGVFAGGNLIIGAIERIARLTGYSTTFWGLSLAAIATSVPELMFTLVGEKKGEQKAAVGNILGSNIYNILLIGGVSMLFSSIPLIANLTWAFFLSSAFSLYGLTQYFKGKVVKKWVAYLFFIFFLIYLFSLELT